MHAQVNRIGKKVVAMQISAFVSVMRKGARAHTIYFRHMFPPLKHSQTCMFYYYEKKHCISISSISTCAQSCCGTALIVMLRIISARLRSVYFPQLHAFDACNNHYESCISPLFWHWVLRISVNLEHMWECLPLGWSADFSAMHESCASTNLYLFTGFSQREIYGDRSPSF